MSCELYEQNSRWGVGVAATFAVGIFTSYLPQQVTIVVRQSTEGINPYFLLLMNLGSSFAFSNVLILARPVFSCCRTSIGAFDCFGSLQGVAQLFAGFLGPTVLLALAVRFREPGDPGRSILRSAKLVAVVDLVVWLLVILVTDPHWSRQLATALGLMALAVGFVQYFPQLYTTYRLKHTGSLSITMMLLQIPGGYLWCLSLAMRKGSHWSTWISLFAAATFQLMLLIMALYYSSKSSVALADQITTPAHPSMASRSGRVSDDAENAESNNERTPLLSE